MTTPPPIFDAAELRAKAEAPCNVGVAGIGDAFIHASLVGDYVAMPPLMLLALLDERATLLARVEVLEALCVQYRALAGYREEQQLQSDNARLLVRIAELDKFREAVRVAVERAKISSGAFPGTVLLELIEELEKI